MQPAGMLGYDLIGLTQPEVANPEVTVRGNEIPARTVI